MTQDDTIFAGAAPYYARYRLPYPADLIADVVAHYGLDGSGMLLDLGCGPGTFTLPLAPHFASAVALDISSDMIEEAKRQPQPSTPIEWRVMPAEAISPALGTFRLATCGSAIHWMERDSVLARVREVLEPGCGIALAGGGSAWWEGPEEWQKLITQLLQKYLGDPRRAGTSGWIRYQTQERFEQTLPRNGWSVDLYRDYEEEVEWDIDRIVGHLWSSSFGKRAHFGDRVDQFEAELRGELLALHPDGRFTERASFGLVCGRPPA